MAAPTDVVHASVAYGSAGNVCMREVQVPPGSTIEDAVRASGMLASFPEIDLTQNAVGVYNRVRSLSDPVFDGDRIEIYRPLQADPKEARRRRAALRRG